MRNDEGFAFIELVIATAVVFGLIITAVFLFNLIF